MKFVTVMLPLYFFFFHISSPVKHAISLGSLIHPIDLDL